MEYNYLNIINTFDSSILISEEGEFVYFLDTNNKGNMLLQEKTDCIIIWSDEIKKISFLEMYQLFIKNIPTSFVFPYIDTQAEFDAILSLGGKTFDFASNFADEEKLCADYSKTFGSLIIERKQKQC